MRMIIVLCAMATVGCAGQDWTRRDTALEISFQVLNVIDGYQTAGIKDHPYVKEVDPVTVEILGPEPESGETALYFATRGISHYLISRALPAKWRPWFQAPTTAHSAWYVFNNCEKGLQPC